MAEEIKTRKTSTLKGRNTYTYHCTNKKATKNLEVLADEAGLSMQAYINKLIEEKAQVSPAINKQKKLEEQTKMVQINFLSNLYLRNCIKDRSSELGISVSEYLNGLVKKDLFTGENN